jgi:hypothetical protein
MLIAVFVAAAIPVTGADAATPVPAVEGPLPVTAGSYPFGAADHQRRPQDLRRPGFVEEEYVMRGSANVYDWPGQGGAVARTAGAPYATRVLVRRPARGRAASGTVWVEMLNPSNLFDLNIGWALAHRRFLGAGDAWVGITAKPVSIQALERFDPERYAALSFANPLPASDPRNCSVTGDSSQATENGLVWDAYSQVAAWIRSRTASNPFRRTRRALRVYGFGYSQTGGYLNTYAAALHRQVTRENRGRPPFDAYLIGASGGSFVGLAPINQCAPLPPPGDPRYVIRNLGVPVIRAMTQTDALAGIAARRADSDRRADRYRHYELAGAAHATPDELLYAAKPADIMRAGPPVPSLACDDGPRSAFPISVHFDALTRNLDRWVRRGVAPPRARRFQVRRGQAVLDRFGNVVGGVRSPDVDVPTSTWLAATTGPGFCAIAGLQRRFSPARLRSLYPSHRAYVRAVAGAAGRLQHRRFITPADARRLVRRARQARVP